MCDGQEASNCDIISLAEYESMVKDQLEKIDNQFNSTSVAVNDKLNAKKKTLIKMCQKDPRIQHDDTFTILQKIIEDLNSIKTEGKIDVGDGSCTGQSKKSCRGQSKKAGPIFLVIFDYEAANTDELSFKKDQKIEFIEDVEEGWAKGKLLDNGKIGLFPNNYVEVCSGKTQII